MSDEKNEILGGVGPEIYKDARKGVLWVAQRPIQWYRRRITLQSFRPDFPSHGERVTDLVDYIKWHESTYDWKNGNGVLYSATYGELPHFWTNADLFAAYEVRLLRFLQNGGTTRRVFVVGPEIRSDASRFLLMRTLYRHIKLGFENRILGIVDLRKVISAISVDCEIVGCLNGHTAYFVKCPPSAIPVMVRSIEPKLTESVERHLLRFWDASIPARQYLNLQNWEAPQSVLDDVVKDIRAIEAISVDKDSV